MRSFIPKQFLLLEGKPVLMHTIIRFHSFDPSIKIVVVLPAEYHETWERLCSEHMFNIPHVVTSGGDERFHSVKAGLAHVTEESLVALHDGVRPLVSHETIERCYADAEQYGNAVPYIEPADSVRVTEEKNTSQPLQESGVTEEKNTSQPLQESGGTGEKIESQLLQESGVTDAEKGYPEKGGPVTGEKESFPLQRSRVKLIQTPQVFQSQLIKKAYQQHYSEAFTDDATVAEADGVKIHLTPGNRENIKITTPEDLVVAGALIQVLRGPDKRNHL